MLLGLLVGIGLQQNSDWRVSWSLHIFDNELGKRAASGPQEAGQHVSKSVSVDGAGRMKQCESVTALTKELGIDRTVLHHRKNRIKAIEGATACDSNRTPVCAVPVSGS